MYKNKKEIPAKKALIKDGKPIDKKIPWFKIFIATIIILQSVTILFMSHTNTYRDTTIELLVRDVLHNHSELNRIENRVDEAVSDIGRVWLNVNPRIRKLESK